MKNVVWVLSVGIMVLASADSISAATRISVTRFDQEVDHIYEGCRSWVFGRQDQLRTVFESELSKQGLQVLERKGIRSIYAQEHTMENLDRTTTPKQGKFLSAQFTITGGITELGICERSSSSGVQLGGLVGLLGGPSGVDLDVGVRSASSRVKVVAQLVSTETGEVLKTFEAESEFKDDGVALGGGYAGIGGSHKSKTVPPIERASNQAIASLAFKIARYFE